MATLDGATQHNATESDASPWYQRRLPAAAVLLAVYVGLALLNDPRGYLGTDTGIKIGTYHVMEDRATGRPVIGYWAAELDPEARAHPFFSTFRVGDQYVDATTLSVLLAGYPLWRLGGYRLALMLPMAGALAAAFVARGVARRLDGPADGWPAFWLAGLASPIAIYALDLWEHTIGVALMAGAVLVLFDALGHRSPWRGALAGALFGLAFSLRTEALVYVVSSFAIVGVALLVRRQLTDAVVLGLGGLGGFAALALANAGLERAVLGGTIRSGRASATAGDVGSEVGVRLREALVTVASPFPSSDREFLTAAALLALALVGLAWWGSRPATAVLAAGCAVVVAVMALRRLLAGPGFWPGLLATTPIAAVAVARGWTPTRPRLLVLLAVVPLPLVFLSQYTGGALPQWGGRYVLTSGLLLGATGAAILPVLLPWVRATFVGLALLATTCGLLWLNVRSHQIGTAVDAVRQRPEDVLIWPDGFVAREFADLYGDGTRWLAANGPDDRAAAFDVARRSGASTLGVLTVVAAGDPSPQPPAVPGFHVTGQSRLPYIDPLQLEVTSYAADAAR
jgi:hypothetical protein